MPKYNVAVPVAYYSTNYYTVEAESESEAEDLVTNGHWDTRDIGEVDYDDGSEDFCSAEAEEV